MDIAQFRIDFPEFSDTLQYPDSQITFWSNLAENLNDSDRLGDCYIYAIELFTAHQITLARDSLNSAEIGGLGGQTSGAYSQKAVGTTSYSLDTSGSSEADAGYFNQTVYGRQYINLIRLVCHGAYQL